MIYKAIFKLLSFSRPSAALWWWGPSAAALLAYLPAVNISAWRPASPFTLLSNLMPASAPVPVSVPSPEAPLDQTPATPVSHPLVR